MGERIRGYVAEIALCACVRVWVCSAVQSFENVGNSDGETERQSWYPYLASLKCQSRQPTVLAELQTFIHCNSRLISERGPVKTSSSAASTHDSLSGGNEQNCYLIESINDIPSVRTFQASSFLSTNKLDFPRYIWGKKSGEMKRLRSDSSTYIRIRPPQGSALLCQRLFVMENVISNMETKDERERVRNEIFPPSWKSSRSRAYEKESKSSLQGILLPLIGWTMKIKGKNQKLGETDRWKRFPFNVYQTCWLEL